MLAQVELVFVELVNFFRQFLILLLVSWLDIFKQMISVGGLWRGTISAVVPINVWVKKESLISLVSLSLSGL